MSTSTQVSELKINKLTKAQYDTITASDTELYFITDDSGVTSSDIITALGYTPADSSTAVTHTASTAVGDTITPVYIDSDGVANALSYTLSKSVPNDAIFTDTVNTTGSINTSSKIYVVGALSQSTSSQTYSNSNVFVDTSSQLNSSNPGVSENSTVVATTKWVNDKGYLTSHQTIKQDGVTGATVNRFGTCSTGASTAAKTVSITAGTFSLEAGAKVTVKFTNANTADSPTLAVGSTDAKSIFHNGTQITTGANKGLLAGTVEFVYDGTQYNLLGASKASTDSVIQNSTDVLTSGGAYTAISPINAVIPSAATAENQLADKDFVNSSIASNTANFIGTFSSVSDLESYSGTVTNNDYAFVINGVVTDGGSDWADFASLDAYDKDLLTNFDYAWVVNSSNFDLYRFDIIEQTWELRVSNTPKASVTLNTAYNRYKASVVSSVVTWDYEYTLNNSSFTAVQWASINSGITSDTKVTHTASTAVGSSTTPVYVDANGAVTALSYTIATSVPSGAVFTDTTYSVFTGADSVTGGASGLVPAPSAGDEDKCLRGDGTWGAVSSSLVGLSDTNISSPTNGQVLSYDSSTSKWVNSTGGGSQYAMVVTDYRE